jgi:hypothetical protein
LWRYHGLCPWGSMTWLADAFVAKLPDVSVFNETVKDLLRKHEEEKNNQRLSGRQSKRSDEKIL